ncbi:hypothetical protein OIU74_020347 [Salix koriyanagi]|uniref:Uncharacterized protein n=1 Tax=Salix koriyanagi TaxID=2511006 RepID=A0A9Q0P5M1_9ROSI|nr:hypothetical protein OIU74_020347 [Salix koriyanagi]
MFLPFTGASLKGNTVSAVNGPVSILRTPMEMVLDPLPLALFCDLLLLLLLLVITLQPSVLVRVTCLHFSRNNNRFINCFQFSLPLRSQNEVGFLFWFTVVITK